jgi:Carboxypeptidase regulatory-like domain/TonB-dependent Receptor Plug Domain
MRVSKFVFAVILALVAQLPLVAQVTSTTATITGTVVDPQGAAVPQAAVTATDLARNTSFKATTDTVGTFVLPQLLPADYSVTVEKEGFKTYIKSGVVLNVGSFHSLGTITLELGAITQTVEVAAQGQQLQTESAERSDTIVGTQIQNIEVNGRTPLSLLRVVPGVFFNMDTSRVKNRLESTYINGSRQNSLNVTLNGTSITGTGDNTKLMATVSLDSVQEFKVLTSNYDAQYGKAAGGTIIMVTKSGGQDFHGSGYWYYRDKGMNANDWMKNRDGVAKSNYHFNFLGYTVGGPVYIPGRFNTHKDKLFFFWSEEYQRQLIPEGIRRVTVPTDLERKGDFSQSVTKNVAYGGTPDAQYIHDPLLPSGHCKAGDTANCLQNNGVIGQIPSAQLYAPGLALLSIFPEPNVSGQKGYNFQSAVSSSNPRHEQLLRMDYNLSRNWRVWGSFTNLVQDVETGAYGPQGYSLTPNYPFPSGGAAQYKHPGYALSLNLTTILNPTSTNEFTYGMAHHLVTVLPSIPTDVTRAGLSLTGANALPTFYAPYADWIPEFSFGGSKISNGPSMRTGGGSFAPFSTYNTTIEFADNYSKILRSHIIKTGIYLQRNRKNQSAYVNSSGTYNFGDSSNNPLDTGFGFANAAVGVYTQFSQASNYLMGEYRYTNLEMYIQDTWKVKPRVTLNYGLRAYYVQPQFDQALQTSTFLPNRYDPTQATQLFWPCYDSSGNKIGVNRQDCNVNAPGAITTAQYLPNPASLYIGKIVPNSGDLTNGILPAGIGINKYLMRNPGILWAPRFGTAIDLTGRGNIVLHAGAGAFYDRYQGNEIFNTITNPPSVYTPTVYNGLAQDLNPSNALLGTSNLTAMSYAGKVPATYNFSVGIQAKLPYQLVLDTSYVGALGRKLLYNLNINGAPYGAAFLTKNQDPTKWGFGNTPICDAANPCDGTKSYSSDYVRPYFGYGNITIQGFGATSNYNSLQVSLSRRYAKGLFLGVAYTWSKCLTWADNDGAGARIDNLTVMANYGPCGYDIRQNLTFNYVYNLPGVTGHGSFDNAVTRGVLNGWQVSGITTYRTGTPFSPGFSISGYDNFSLTGTGAFGARVKLVGDPTSGTSGSPYNRLDPAAFAPPTRPSLGIESGVNYVNNPGQSNWDMSLQKNIPLKERVHLELRVDAFNVFNHTQFSGINSTINFNCGSVSNNCATYTVTNLPFNSSGQLVNKTGFGTVNGVYNPRVLQTVVRIVF